MSRKEWGLTRQDLLAAEPASLLWHAGRCSRVEQGTRMPCAKRAQIPCLKEMVGRVTRAQRIDLERLTRHRPSTPRNFCSSWASSTSVSGGPETPSRAPGQLIRASGFFTTFTLLARDHYSPGQMSWMLVRVCDCHRGVCHPEAARGRGLTSHDLRSRCFSGGCALDPPCRASELMQRRAQI